MDNLDIDGVQNYLITEIESVRKLLISPKNMFVYMAVNVDKLTEQVSDVYAPWNKYFSDLVTSEKPKYLKNILIKYHSNQKLRAYFI